MRFSGNRILVSTLSTRESLFKLKEFLWNGIFWEPNGRAKKRRSRGLDLITPTFAMDIPARPPTGHGTSPPDVVSHFAAVTAPGSLLAVHAQAARSAALLHNSRLPDR